MTHWLGPFSGTPGRRPWIVALVGVIGLGLSLTLFGVALQQDETRRALAFERQASSVAAALERNLDDYVQILEHLGAVSRIYGLPTRAQFERLAVEARRKHAGIQALEWIPRVPAAQRGAYEARARAEGLSLFRFTERTARGFLRPAGPRAEYYPVYYLEPIEGNEAALGFAPPPGTHPRDQVLARARDTGKLAVSGGLSLVQAPRETGLVCVLPLYRPGAPVRTVAERREAFLGGLQGVFRLQAMSAAALEGLDTSGVAYWIVDESAGAGGVLYASPGASAIADAGDREARLALDRIRTFPFADRHWTVLAAPQADPAGGPSIAVWGTLLGGLALTLGSTAYLRSLLDRQRTVERLVEERTAEIARSREEVAAIQALDSLKDAFVNAISHDLRTPLTSVLGYAEFLEDGIGGELSASQRSYVEQILQSAHRLEHLVDDLLDFARAQAGKLVVQTESADLRRPIEAVARSLAPQLQTAGLTLALTLPPRPVTVAIDVLRIERVLVNLLANAIKFTPEHGRIAVRLNAAGPMAEVSVSDTGVGISLQDQERLFERFVQLPEGVRRGGTGLGLSICKAIVEAHGGTIRVESAPGAGSTFTFTVPLAPLGSAPLAPAAEA